MNAKASLAQQNFVPVSWQGSRSARSVLLLQMAADAEKLAAIGARIVQLRESLRDPATGRKLTQTALGQAIDVSYRSVQNWEKGVGVEGIKAENIKALADYFRGRGLEHATEDYIEHGVVKRERQPTPDLSRNGDFTGLREQLQALGARIDQLAAKLGEPPVADQLAAIAERIETKVEAVNLLNEDRAAEVQQRIGEGLAAIEDLLRRRLQA